MARLSLLLICLASIFAYNSAYSEETWGDISAKLQSVNEVGVMLNTTSQKNFTKTVEENKNLTKLVETNDVLTKLVESKPRFLLQPRQATTTTTTTTTITYRLGQRITGDRLVASNTSSAQWTVAQNVTQNLTYPRTGVGAVITYIEVVVAQDSNLGRGFTTSGGIEQRQIAITIEAYRTRLFRQNAQIYGY